MKSPDFNSCPALMSYLFFFFCKKKKKKKKPHLNRIIAYAKSKSKAWTLMREVCRKNKENAVRDSEKDTVH